MIKENSNLSKNNQAVIQAYEKGYRVNENGDVIFKNRKLKLSNDKGGYFVFSVRVIINDKKIGKVIRVHRLQAYQKYGCEIFKKDIDVRHKNGNNKDNSYENILIGTKSENMMDRSPESRKKQAIIASNNNRRFTDKEVELINIDRRLGLKYAELCEKYNTSKSTLSYLFNKSIYVCNKQE